MRIPALTREQMREVDRIMVEDLGIDLVRMMENAGRSLADLVVRRFRPHRVSVLAGPGGNGGGGLVAARHLANRGVEVRVACSRRPEGTVPADQLRILERMGVGLGDRPVGADLIVDALIGYGLEGDPRGRAAELIRWTGRRGVPVVSLDNPSGLNVTTGECGDPCVAATVTMTLALPKAGLLDAHQAGELYLADVSVPPTVYRALGVEVPSELFAEGVVVPIVRSGSDFVSRRAT